MNINLTIYNNYIDKDISIGSNSHYVKYVNIDNEYIYLKKHKKKSKYINEKKKYLLLKNEFFLPKLKYFDDKNCILGIEDCGTSLKLFKTNNAELYNNIYPTINEKLKSISDKLYNNYKLYHNDLIYRNIYIDNNNNIKLIDFEYCSDKCKNIKYFICEKHT